MRTAAILLVLGLLAALPASAFADEEPVISVRFEHTDVVKVIEIIAEKGNANVIVSPEVKGTISVHFDKTPWRDALDVVVKTAGCELVAQEHGIFTVRPNAAKKKYEDASGFIEAGRELRAKVKKAEDERRALYAEVARAARRAQALEDLAGLAERIDAEQVLQFHAVEDLVKAGHDVLVIARNSVGDGATELALREGTLVVRATPAAQKKLTVRLGQLRGSTDYAVAGRVVAEDGKPVKSFKVVTKKGTSRSTFHTRTDADGLFVSTDNGVTWKPLGAGGKGGGGGRAGKPGKPGMPGQPGRVTTADAAGVWFDSKGTDPKQVALRARAEKLRAAARLLQAAGDPRGAAAASDKADVALKEAATLRRRAAETLRLGSYGMKLKYGRTSAPGDDKLLRAVEGLRGEVRALRTEVQELTGLVRQLVKRRR